MDSHGLPWTPVDSKARRSGPYGLPWTPLDTAWRSTDQKVWGFESLRACRRSLCAATSFESSQVVRPPDVWEPFALVRAGRGDGRLFRKCPESTWIRVALPDPLNHAEFLHLAEPSDGRWPCHAE